MLNWRVKEMDYSQAGLLTGGPGYSCRLGDHAASGSVCMGWSDMGGCMSRAEPVSGQACSLLQESSPTVHACCFFLPFFIRCQHMHYLTSPNPLAGEMCVGAMVDWRKHSVEGRWLVHLTVPRHRACPLARGFSQSLSWRLLACY